MNVVNQYGEKWNVFAEVVAFCHVTYRNFDRFLPLKSSWKLAPCLLFLFGTGPNMCTSLISIVLDAFIFQYSVPLIITNCYTKVFPSLTITKPMQACQ